MTLETADVATMDPLDFARLVKQSSSQEMHRLMHGRRRGVVLDQLVARMPDAFRADRAHGLDAIVHWRIGDRPDGGADLYQFVIADGVCKVSGEASGEPRLTLSLSAVDFLRLVTGNAHPVMLTMRGRLKARGDVGLTAKFPTLFDPPKP